MQTIFIVENCQGRYEEADFIGIVETLDLAVKGVADFTDDHVEAPFIGYKGILITEIRVGDFSENKYIGFYNYKGEKVSFE